MQEILSNLIYALSIRELPKLSRL